MDLSFPPHLPAAGAAESALPAADLARLAAMLRERGAAGATAPTQPPLPVPRGGDAPLAPPGGAFNPMMAARLALWREG